MATLQTNQNLCLVAAREDTRSSVADRQKRKYWALNSWLNWENIHTTTQSIQNIKYPFDDR